MISRPAISRPGSSASKVTVKRCPHCLKATLISKFNEHLALCTEVQKRNPSLNSQMNPIPSKQGSNQFRIKQSPNIRKSEEPVLNRSTAQRMTERIMVGQKPQRPFHASNLHAPANNILNTNPKRQPVSVNKPNKPRVNGDSTATQGATKQLEDNAKEKAEKERIENADRQKVEAQRQKQKERVQREKQRVERERVERERVERERVERERVERERQRLERERVERERVERERAERERAERERVERERGRVARQILGAEMQRMIVVDPLNSLHSRQQSVESEQLDVAQRNYSNTRNAVQEANTQLSTLAQNSRQIIAFVQSLGMQNDERMRMGIQQLRQLIFISRQVSELSTIGHSLYNGIGNVFADRIRQLQATIVQQIGNVLMLGFERRIASQFQSFARQAIEKKVCFTEEEFDRYFSQKFVIEECQCPICLGAILAEVVELQCDHLFHRDCIKEWLRESTKCPMCRREQLKA